MPDIQLWISTISLSIPNTYWYGTLINPSESKFNVPYCLHNLSNSPSKGKLVMLANFFSFSDLVHAQVAENEGEAVVGHASSKDRVGVTPPKLLKIIIITILVRPLVQHSSFLFPDIFTLFTINSQKLGSFLIRSKNKIPPSMMTGMVLIPLVPVLSVLNSKIFYCKYLCFDEVVSLHASCVGQSEQCFDLHLNN